MGGKYSAQWREKIASINREISGRHDASSIVDDLIQATASGISCEEVPALGYVNAPVEEPKESPECRAVGIVKSDVS
jgi:hypothetical protein